MIGPLDVLLRGATILNTYMTNQRNGKRTKFRDPNIRRGSKSTSRTTREFTENASGPVVCIRVRQISP